MKIKVNRHERYRTIAFRTRIVFLAHLIFKIILIAQCKL